MNINFYQPSETFLSIKEHVVVSDDNNVIGVFGPNGFDSPEEYLNWIDTVAYSILFKMSGEVYCLITKWAVTYNMIENIKYDTKKHINDFLKICDIKDEKLANKIYERIVEISDKA